MITFNDIEEIANDFDPTEDIHEISIGEETKLLMTSYSELIEDVEDMIEEIDLREHQRKGIRRALDRDWK